MKTTIYLLLLSLTSFVLTAQEEAKSTEKKADPIYDKYLNILEGMETIKNLEEKTKNKVVTRMITKKGNKIISYYQANSNEFIGFSADLEKISILHVPYFRSLKGLKHYLAKDTPPREALTRYYVNHPKPTINIYD